MRTFIDIQLSYPFRNPVKLFVFMTSFGNWFSTLPSPWKYFFLTFSLSPSTLFECHLCLLVLYFKRKILLMCSSGLSSILHACLMLSSTDKPFSENLFINWDYYKARCQERSWIPTLSRGSDLEDFTDVEAASERQQKQEEWMESCAWFPA